MEKLVINNQMRPVRSVSLRKVQGKVLGKYIKYRESVGKQRKAITGL